MRIARILTRANLGGPARQVLASDPLLVARGHQLRIFVGSSEPGEGDLSETWRAHGLDVLRVPGLARAWNVRGDLRARRFLAAELARFAPQIVHTHASKAGALGRPAARKLGALSVHTFHGHVLEGYFHPALSRAILSLERRLARCTDAVIAVSHATAQDLLRLEVVEAEKLTVIVPGVNLTPFLERGEEGGSEGGVAQGSARAALRHSLGLEPDALLLLQVGRLARVKRPAWALEVLQLLLPRHPRLALVFVGDGEERTALERGVAERGLVERVRLIGAREEMAPLLHAADVVLSCSSSEGLPVALIEAAAAGLPIVATRVGGVEELVVDERTGYLGDTIDELAYGVARVLEQQDLGRAMGARARLRVRDRHSARALADRLEALYRGLWEARACAS